MPKLFARRGWTTAHLLLTGALVVLGTLATLSAWADILHIARTDEESSHIFLVPLIAAWLIWVRRGRLRLCQPRGMWVGPILVAVGWGISTLGFYHAIQSFWHGGAVLVVIGCLLAGTGTDVLFRFFPAFIVLIFLVPVPGMIRQQIAIPLQTATAQVTQILFDLMAIPVERSGNLLSINGQDVAIAEACNGMRMVFALVLVCFAFAFGEPLRQYVRVLILAASPLSAILCNVIRMLPTLWLYGYGSKVVQFVGLRPRPGQTVAELGKSLADGFHDISGWIMLGIAFLLLMGIIRLLQWALIPITHYNLASD
jgi:exosortase